MTPLLDSPLAAAPAVPCALASPPPQAGDSKAAIDCCVLLHQWDQAMALAAAHAYPQAEQLLAKYAGHLLDKKRYMETVELYKKVGEGGWG